MITRNNVFKNNILSNTKGGTLFEAANCETQDKSRLMIADMDYNAYYRKSSSKPQKLINWSLGKGKCSVGYRDIVTFKSATKFEANALFVDNVATDPFFVNAASGDFCLKPGSLATLRGEALPADITTAIGLPPGTGVDLGTLQSQVVLSEQTQPAHTYVR